jgi:hypothetical protein
LIKIISYCGLLCSSCPIYLATREPNELRKREMILGIIQACKEHYGIEYKYEDINECDGCITKSQRLFCGCANCKIRMCVTQKEIENCAYCKDYPCQDLKNTFEPESGAKERLDKIKDSLIN